MEWPSASAIRFLVAIGLNLIIYGICVYFTYRLFWKLLSFRFVTPYLFFGVAFVVALCRRAFVIWSEDVEDSATFLFWNIPEAYLFWIIHVVAPAVVGFFFILGILFFDRHTSIAIHALQKKLEEFLSEEEKKARAKQESLLSKIDLLIERGRR